MTKSDRRSSTHVPCPGAMLLLVLKPIFRPLSLVCPRSSSAHVHGGGWRIGQVPRACCHLLGQVGLHLHGGEAIIAVGEDVKEGLQLHRRASEVGCLTYVLYFAPSIIPRLVSTMAQRIEAPKISAVTSPPYLSGIMVLEAMYGVYYKVRGRERAGGNEG